MATQTYDAVYQGGAFRPTRPVAAIEEGQHVRLLVETEETPTVLELATGVYEGLSKDDARDVEEIALNRKAFFERSA